MVSGLSGTVEATTLTESQMPRHKHTFTSGGWETQGGANATEGSFDWTADTSFAGGSQSHTHALDGSTGSTDSLPPYYVLSLIMRIS